MRSACGCLLIGVRRRNWIDGVTVFAHGPSTAPETAHARQTCAMAPQLSARLRTAIIALSAFAGFVGPAALVPPAATAATACWSTEYDGIRFCRGKVEFDGGGDFASARSRQRFNLWAKTGKPKEFDLGINAGVLRWRQGDCVFTHGAGGNWNVTCGSRSAMAAVAAEYFFVDQDAEPLEVSCKNRSGTVEVFDTTLLGFAYPENVCSVVGAKPTR